MASPSPPVFDLSGASLALDFANTWEDRGRPETEKLGSYDDLLAFAVQAAILDRRQAGSLTARVRERPEDATGALLVARKLREALYRLFSKRAAGGGGADAGDLELLNRTVAESAALLRLESDGPEFAWRWRGLDSSPEAVLAPIARSAADLLTGGDLGRLRECAGTGCTWLFLDSSRNRSRRWCSMESCGNRAKARRHYRRSRAADSPD